MGSLLSLIVANLYMEEFEIKAINSAPQPPPLLEKICGLHLYNHQVIPKNKFPGF